MSIDRAVLAFAGLMVLLSVLLTHFVHPGFVWFTAFMGGEHAAVSLHRLLPGCHDFPQAGPPFRHSVLRTPIMQKIAFIPLFAATVAAGLTAAQAADLKLEAVSIPEMKAVYGQIQPRNTVLARARLGGTVVKLGVTEGDIVKAGDVIAEVKDDKIDFQIKAVDAQLQGLNASMNDAQVELDRADRLVRSGAASTQRLDQLRTQLDVITNQVRQAEAQRSLLVQQTSEGAVLAPSDGRVISVPVTRDAVVMPGETVATIAGGGFFLRLAIRNAMPTNYPRAHRSASRLAAKSCKANW